MQYVSAVALASLSGKAPTRDSVLAILKAAGQPVDEAQVDAVLQALNNRKVDEVISKGLSKVSVGGAASAPAAAQAPKKEEKKKEEKKPEPKKKEPEPAPEEDDMPIDLFG